MPKCSSCGSPVEGYPGKMVGNVKCDACRKTPAKFKRVGQDTDTQVACRECGVLRRQLIRHLATAHQMTAALYLSKYPGALIEVPGSRGRSDACRAKQSEAATRRWSSTEEREQQSQRMQVSGAWKGLHLSEEHRAAISAGGRGVQHQLTDGYRQIVGERGRLTLIEVRQRPGYGDRLRVAIKQRMTREGDRFGLRSPESRAKALATRIQNGNLIPKGCGRGITGFRKGIDHYCRSTLEANFARILVYEGVPYEYEPRVFQLPGGGRWTPDFRLLTPLGAVPAGWVELKGWRKPDGSFAGGASEKIRVFEEQTGESVFVLCMQDPLWAELAEAYSDKVSWETPRCNLRTHPKEFGRPAR